MSEQQSIRDEMRGTIESGIVLSRWDDEQIMFAAKITDLLLASPVIRRIQADARAQELRDMADDLESAGGYRGLFYGIHRLRKTADEIERGE